MSAVCTSSITAITRNGRNNYNELAINLSLDQLGVQGHTNPEEAS